ncbi:MAG: hypothetical protein ACTHKG_07235 [Nocardioides sp.]
MRTDELTRALHQQADEALATAPTFDVQALGRRRARTRRRAVAGGAVAATLAAVTSVVLLTGDPAPRGGEPGPVDRPSETPSADESHSPRPSPPTQGSSAWQAVECITEELGGCDVPMTLTYRGRTWTRAGGADGSQPVHAPNGVNREIGMSVVPTGTRQLVLVGATGAGPGSELSVSLNSSASEPVDPGPLTPVLVDATPDSQHVTVREDGTAPRDEVLQIATYVPAG